MIIVLNGYPGVGKLTIGRALADLLQGRLLDIHSLYNVGFALTEPKSREFRETVEKIEAIAHDLILKLPPSEPVVLTTVLAGDSEWGDDEWARIVRLGIARPPLFVTLVTCDLDENLRRIQSDDRRLMHKLRDPETARRNWAEAKPLYGHDEHYVLELDATKLSAEAAARSIADWVSANEGVE